MASPKGFDKEYIFNLIMPSASEPETEAEETEPEPLVADRLEAVFEKFNCCRCDKCRHDVAALALNTVQPQYVVTTLEEIPALLEAADTREIPGALVKAILHVKNHPKH